MRPRILSGLLGVALAAALSATAGPAVADTALRAPQLSVHDAGATSAADTAGAGSYVPLASPARLLDGHRLRAGHLVTIPVAGHGGVPTTGAGSALITVTASGAGSAGALVAYSGSRPATATVQFALRGSSTDSAVVPLDPSGAIDVADTGTTGRVTVAVDVLGWFRSGAASTTDPGTFHAVTPKRVLRTGTPLRAQQRITPKVAGVAGVRPGAGAVAVTITALRPTAAGSLLAADGATEHPSAAIGHFAAGRSTSSFAILPVSGRRISVLNGSSGRTGIAVDVLGWFTTGVPESAGTLGTLAPTTVAGKPLARNSTTTLTVGGRAGVPRAQVAAVLATVDVVKPSASGSLQAWQPGATRPAAAVVASFAAGRTVADTVLLPVAHGQVVIRNVSAGRATVQLDVLGYVASNAVPAPDGTATARYLDALTSSPTANYLATDKTIMNGYGCADAQAGVQFALLDIGAQSRTGPQLSSAHPGVLIAPTTSVRLRYPDLREVLDSYLAGYTDADCNQGGTHLTLALGTNNDGAFSGKTAYPATTRGTDWANQVVDAVAGDATTQGDPVTVIGAIDIEAAFASTEAQAQDWENAYLAATGARLVYNGDANDCPTAFGVTGRSCAFGWTQKQYYSLAHRSGQIQVLPQIFGPAEAVKWADIDATGGGGLQFVGALTEHARVTAELSPSQGRAALYRALSSVVAAPRVRYAVDLQAG